jgi:CubicO group peptidase (beta-lactamase class C family)
LSSCQKGKLSLDDKLEKFIPGLPGGDKITIHMMLSHQSGFPPTSHEDASIDMAMTKEKVLEVLKQKPLEFEPGTTSGYSNTAFLLLAYVIEAAVGGKLHELHGKACPRARPVCRTAASSIRR